MIIQKCYKAHYDPEKDPNRGVTDADEIVYVNILNDAEKCKREITRKDGYVTAKTCFRDYEYGRYVYIATLAKQLRDMVNGAHVHANISPDYNQ